MHRKLHEKNYIKIEKQLNKERSRWNVRYLRKARRTKAQPLCTLKALFIIYAVLYLVAVWGLKDRILQVRQENTLMLEGTVSEQPKGSFKETINKIILRLKTGEIVLYHESVR